MAAPLLGLLPGALVWSLAASSSLSRLPLFSSFLTLVWTNHSVRTYPERVVLSLRCIGFFVQLLVIVGMWIAAAKSSPEVNTPHMQKHYTD